MWAGPLCGQLMAQAGATVVKVESRARPDGTRAGPVAFFDWMNSKKLSYAVDFDSPEPLRTLLAAADVVIESSRPAALARRGLGPHDVDPRDGRVWLRITGHGADGERAEWVAFGDDAAVSGGLVGMADDGPVFFGDAIADPLTGLHGALAVVESLSRGGAELIDISMAAVAATYAALPTEPGGSRLLSNATARAVRHGIGAWRRQCDSHLFGRKAFSRMLIQRASLLDGVVTDIRADDEIVEVADRLPPQRGEQVFDAGLNTVIPGLHDHHVHVYSAAAARDSVWVGPPSVRTARWYGRRLGGREARVGRLDSGDRLPRVGRR